MVMTTCKRWSQNTQKNCFHENLHLVRYVHRNMLFGDNKKSTCSPVPAYCVSLSLTFTLFPAALRKYKQYQATCSPPFGVYSAGFKIILVQPLYNKMGGGGTYCDTTPLAILSDLIRSSTIAAFWRCSYASYENLEDFY